MRLGPHGRILAIAMRYFRSMKPFLWVLALALVVVRIADAHVHWCFDGQEPRSSLHVSDNGVVCHTQQAPGSSPEGEDVDIAAVGAALAKKDSQDQTIVPIPVGDVVFAFSPPPANSVARPSALDTPVVKRPYLHRPRLRGPPV